MGTLELEADFAHHPSFAVRSQLLSACEFFAALWLFHFFSVLSSQLRIGREAQVKPAQSSARLSSSTIQNRVYASKEAMNFVLTLLTRDDV